jgi:hypothetical protein
MMVWQSFIERVSEFHPAETYSRMGDNPCGDGARGAGFGLACQAEADRVHRKNRAEMQERRTETDRPAGVR